MDFKKIEEEILNKMSPAERKLVELCKMVANNEISEEEKVFLRKIHQKQMLIAERKPSRIPKYNRVIYNHK